MQCAHLAFQRKIWSVGWKIIACSVELKCSNLIEKVENVRNVDDQIWNFVEGFIDGKIPRDAFWGLVRFNYPTHQIVFCTESALKMLTFEGSETL